MNKPYWIICQDKKHADKVAQFIDFVIRHGVFGAGCPVEWSGKPCPLDENGKRMTCEQCWLSQFEIITEDENDGDKE